MPSFQAKFPEFESHVRAVFDEQSFMRGIGAEIDRVSPGAVEIVLPFRDDLLQHHGYVHGAVIAAIVDTACGCSALTLMPAGSTVLTVEYKINFMAPAAGERLIARGKVLRPGRKLTVCSGEVVATVDGDEKPVAALMATMVRIPPTPASAQ